MDDLHALIPPPEVYRVPGLPSVIDPICNRDYTTSQNWRPARDPLVLDLNGAGISTVGINPLAPILFDHDGDGIKTGTGWLGAGEGILVLDLNANGTIDSGRELFGDNTLLQSGPNAGQLASNGFTGLAQYDQGSGTVVDGKINSQDAIYTQLRIWQDTNQDGISQATELTTLAQRGIASINLVATQTNTALGNGNTQTWTGSFTRSDGSSGTAGTADLVGSLDLAANNFYRQFTDNPVLTAAAQGLPQMRGSNRCSQFRSCLRYISLTHNAKSHQSGRLENGSCNCNLPRQWGRLRYTCTVEHRARFGHDPLLKAA
jgi:hypothetical protein